MSTPLRLRERSWSVSLFVSVTALAAAASCQGAGHVKVAFGNAPGSIAATRAGLTVEGAAPAVADGTTPDVFGIKMTAIYLAEDVDPMTMDNVGQVARIWTNPTCDPGLYHCGISPNAGDYQVKDYFDLALPTEQVNANLNSQSMELGPGTYRYLRVDFVGIEMPENQGTPDLQFGRQGGAVNEVRFRSNNYNVAIDPPMDIADGDSLVVTLNYDLTGIYYDGPGLDAGNPPAGGTIDRWYCTDNTTNPAGGPCLYFVGFSPAVTKMAAATPSPAMH